MSQPQSSERRGGRESVPPYHALPAAAAQAVERFPAPEAPRTGRGCSALPTQFCGHRLLQTAQPCHTQGMEQPPLPSPISTVAEIADAMGRDRVATAETVASTRRAVAETKELLDKTNGRPPAVGPATQRRKLPK